MDLLPVAVSGCLHRRVRPFCRCLDSRRFFLAASLSWMAVNGWHWWWWPFDVGDSRNRWISETKDDWKSPLKPSMPSVVNVWLKNILEKRWWATENTTLQSVMNAKLSKHRFWPSHENGRIKTNQTIPHNLFMSVKLTFLYCGLRLILVYPNP